MFAFAVILEPDAMAGIMVTRFRYGILIIFRTFYGEFFDRYCRTFEDFHIDNACCIDNRYWKLFVASL
jgi:hypothetical protein